MEDRLDSTQEKYYLESDILTGTNRRASFYRQAAQLIGGRKTNYAVVTWDINRFKIINELYGLENGDRVLVALADAIRDYVGADGVFGRLASDNFAACIPADRLKPDEMMDELQGKMRLDGIELRPDLYCGIYLVEDPEIPVGLMCDRANLALSTVKRSYLNRYAYYNDGMKTRLLEEQQLINEMQTALEQRQFCFHLQPIASASGGTVASSEALVRWNHPEKGLIAPGAFIPLAEKNGFITKIDWYVWEEVCKYIMRKKKRGEAILPISVNMSRMDFYVPDICGKICALTEKYGIDTGDLRFEITENAYMEDPCRMIEIAGQLRKCGFKVLMDDFGSEYSSLNMLKDIQVDFLKIDMRFLEGFDKSGRAANVITSVVRMAKWLDTAVVAEGVETKEQLRFLKSIGCDLIQGYYYSKPLPTAQYESFLKNREPRAVEQEEVFADGFDFDALFNNHEVDFLFGRMLDAAGVYEMQGESLEIIRVNDRYYDVMGVLPDQIYRDTKNAFTYIWAEDQKLLIDTCIQARRDGNVKFVDIRRSNGKDRILWLHVKIRFIGKRGEGSVFFFLIDDVTEKKRVEAELQDSRERQRQDELCRMLVEDSEMIIYDYDAVNDEMFYSIPIGEGMRRSWEIQRFTQYIKQSPLFHRDDVIICLEHLQNVNFSVARNEFEHRADYYGDGYRWYRTSYRSLRDNNQHVHRIIGHALDITEKRKWKERAERDGLTGLLNRSTMEYKVNDLLRKKNFRGAFFLFDIDNFKTVNDTCGHTVGDGLLMCIARIFELNFREMDLKCRLGGDELAVLTINPMEECHIIRRAEDVLEAVRTLRGEMQLCIPVSISVGIACADEGTWSFENLYQRADAALYQAKREGKNRFCIE